MKIRTMGLLAFLGLVFCAACAKQTTSRDIKGNAEKAFEHLDAEKANNGK